MKNSKWLLLMLSWVVLLGLLASFAYAADDKYIVVDVEAVGKDRNSAIDSAFLDGVRQAVGSFIDAKTELNNEQLSERIISYSRGLVEKYEDDSLAGEGIYKLKMRLYIVQELLRDGAKHATAGGAEIAFSPADLKRKQEELDAKAAKELEAKNAAAETAKRKAQSGAELLEAMLNRYKAEDFLTCYIPGKPEIVKGKIDTFSLNVELSFNEKLYKENFIPDLIQVLDQVASVKKNNLLVKNKNDLRNLAAKKGINGVPDCTSIILRANERELAGDYTLAVYNKPENFGCRLYGFNDEITPKIDEVLKNFCRNTWRVKGILLELLDENKEVIDTIEKKFNIAFLTTNKARSYSIQPTILINDNQSEGWKERKQFTIPFELELPEEILPVVKNIKASLLMDEATKPKTSMLIGEAIKPKTSMFMGAATALKTLKRPGGWLGVVISTYKEDQGALIKEVFADSAAEKAGLKKEDIITKVNMKSITTSSELIEYLSTLYEGDQVLIRVRRFDNNNKMSVLYFKVTLGAKP